MATVIACGSCWGTLADAGCACLGLPELLILVTVVDHGEVPNPAKSEADERDGAEEDDNDLLRGRVPVQREAPHRA